MGWIGGISLCHCRHLLATRGNYKERSTGFTVETLSETQTQWNLLIYLRRWIMTFEVVWDLDLAD